MNCRRLLLSLAFTAAISAPVVAAEEEQAIKVKGAEVLDKPARTGALLGTLQYGDNVKVLDASNASWKRIEALTAGKVTGWIRAAALVKKEELQIDRTGVSSSVTSADLMNAGKGINPQMEKDYVTQNNLQAQLAMLDAIEANPLFKVTGPDKAAFMAQGNLVAKGGE